jgi:membrane-associated phospholipid phosphatase
VGCADSSIPTPSQPFAPDVSADAIKFWEAGASVQWNSLLRDLIAGKPAASKPNQQATVRAFTYLSLAQYDAIVAAEQGKDGAVHPSARGAVAGASAAVLEYLFPADAAAFESAVQGQRSAPRYPGETRTDFAAGETIGRALGAAVVAAAQTDRFTAPWTGTVPTGPGFWFSTAQPPAPPLLPMLGQMRPFFMTSGSQFRPGPPPAFGSPAYLAALAEIRNFSDTRTPEQLAIARYWAGTTGSLVGGFWNAEIASLVVSHHLDERRAAHAFALVNMAAMDANIACHDAKYTYWLIRPSQADPAITTPIGLPNHPSYPSNHACVSAATAYVLGALFPDQAARLSAMAAEAAESRLYAGIHYRFDAEAGLRIARQVADLALNSDVRGNAAFALP